MNGYPYEAISHTSNAVHITQYMSNYFVEQTKLNTHTFKDSDEESSRLIYNYTPLQTEEDFIQTYYFQF